MKKMIQINKIWDFCRNISRIPLKMDQLQKAVGRIEYRQLQATGSKDIQNYEFQVFSQWQDDGIIQYLIHNTPIQNKIFIEFGVQDYTESNTRFLLQNNNWSGLVIDGSQDNIKYIKNDPIYWRYNLKAECAFIDRGNINSLILNSGISGDIGLLSIDIDGNDYWVWEAIDCISPRIVICEYNSLFGPVSQVTVPYDNNFQRTKAHLSNLYFGASISALNSLAERKGYSLIAVNSAGNNAFFLRNDLLGDDTIPQSPANVYIKAQFRESRDNNGTLTFIDFDEGLDLIKDLIVTDLSLDREIKVKEIKPY